MATLSCVTNIREHDLWRESLEGGGPRCRLQRLVASKIARINIRARHCHSVNFPRCWLYRVRDGDGAGAGREGGGRTGGKHRYPYPRWNFMRLVGSMLRTRGCIFVEPTPFRFTSMARCNTRRTLTHQLHTYVHDPPPQKKGGRKREREKNFPVASDSRNVGSPANNAGRW